MKGKERSVVPQVDELSDLQWARIERGLWAKLDAEVAPMAPAPTLRASSSWRVRGLAVGGVLALAAVAALVLFWRGPQGAEELAEAPSRVMTRDSATTVSFADAAIEVSPRSAVLLSGGGERSAMVVLEEGRAGFRVAPRKRPFLVVAGHATVRVVGTHFAVARDGEVVEVEVHEGEVAVQYLGHVHQVIGGQSWRSTAVKPVVQAAVLQDGGAKQGSEQAPAQPDALPRQPRPAQKPAQQVRPAQAEQPAQPEQAEQPVRPAQEPERPEAPVVAKEAADEGEARKAFAAATRLESSAPRDALRGYLSLARRDDRWGANALYAAARLSLDIGERAQAARLARSYLQRFPEGANAADARLLLEVDP